MCTLCINQLLVVTEVRSPRSLRLHYKNQDCTTAHPNSPGVNISCIFVNSSPVQGRSAGLLWRHCLITATREWFSDNSCSAFSTNSSRIFTSDRARSSPVESGYVEGRRGRTGVWVMVKSAKCANENTSRLGSYTLHSLHVPREACTPECLVDW